MPGNSAFEMVGERGWRRGLGTLMKAGFASWWSTNTWWIFALIWTGVTAAMLAGLLWATTDTDPDEGVLVYCITSGVFAVVAVVILMMSAVVGEKKSGTAAWILSKPVSRQAFILSKLVPNAVGVLVTMEVVPGLAAYLLLSLAGVQVTTLGFLAGMAVLGLNLLFYLTLTLMLGTFFEAEGGVIAIPLALAFGQNFVQGLSPLLLHVLPWTLALPSGDESPSIAASLMQGHVPYSIGPIIVAACGAVLFVAVALWRFQRQEL